MAVIFSLVSAHCGQLVESRKIRTEDGDRIKGGKYGLSAIGQSTTHFGQPLGDFRAPSRYRGVKPEKLYAKMLEEGLTVKDLFEEVVENQKVVLKFDEPKYGGYNRGTCGYYDPNLRVVIDEDTNPQSSSTGNNHDGPAEVWIDDVRTSHISNLMAPQPEVLDRKKYNCNKDWCDYRWYWIAFRAHHTVETSGSSFQMWVQCAKIKGNGNDPIPVETTGVWMEDTRDPKTKNDNIAENKVGLEITPNPSEREALYVAPVITESSTSSGATQTGSYASAELIFTYYPPEEGDADDSPGAGRLRR